MRNNKKKKLQLSVYKGTKSNEICVWLIIFAVTMLVGTWHLFLVQVSGLVTHCCGMDPIHQLAFVSQCGCVGHSGTSVQ